MMDDEGGGSNPEEEDISHLPKRPISTEGKYGRYGRLSAAFRTVKEGKSIRQAAKLHKVPPTTLGLYIRRGGQISESKKGRRPSLDDGDEQGLVEWCLEMTRIGCPLIRKELPLVVQSVLKAKKRMVFPPDNIPSQGWVDRFLGRHEVLSNRVPEHLSHFKSFVTYTGIMNFFTEMKAYLKSRDLDVYSFLSKENASCVFSCIESRFYMNPNEESSKVLVKRAMKTPHEPGNESQFMATVLFCVSASGAIIRPLFVTQGKTPNHYTEHEGLDHKSYSVACSGSRWMTGELFHSWLVNIFHRDLVDQNIRRPVILFVDGYSSHIFLDTLYFARDNGIILYCLPPHASHILQPLDVGVLKSVKDNYRVVVRECLRKLTKQGLPKVHFPYMFMKAIDQGTVKENAISGFKATGLVPFNPSAIQRDQFLDCQDESLPEVMSPEPQAKTLADIYREGYMAGQADILRRCERLIPSDELAIFQKRYEAGMSHEHYSLAYRLWRALKSITLCPSTPYDVPEAA